MKKELHSVISDQLSLASFITIYTLLLIPLSASSLYFKQPVIAQWQNSQQQKQRIILSDISIKSITKLLVINKIPYSYQTNDNCEINYSGDSSSIYAIKDKQYLVQFWYAHYIDSQRIQQGKYSSLKPFSSKLFEVIKFKELQLKRKIFFDYENKLYQIQYNKYSQQPRCYFFSNIDQNLCQMGCNVKTPSQIVINHSLNFNLYQNYQLINSQVLIPTDQSRFIQLSFNHNHTLNLIQFSQSISIKSFSKIKQISDFKYLLEVGLINTGINVALIKIVIKDRLNIILNKLFIINVGETLALEGLQVSNNVQIIVSHGLNYKQKIYLSYESEESLNNEKNQSEQNFNIQKSENLLFFMIIICIVVGVVFLVCFGCMIYKLFKLKNQNNQKNKFKQPPLTQRKLNPEQQQEVQDKKIKTLTNLSTNCSSQPTLQRISNTSLPPIQPIIEEQLPKI